MQWTLIVMLWAQAGTGPEVPLITTVPFADRAACEAGAKAMDRVTQPNRRGDFGSGRAFRWECVPSATEKKPHAG